MNPSTIERKRAQRICTTARCMRSDGRTQAGHSDCHTCKSRKDDARHPMRRLYRNLKASARRRRIAFEIPFECFELFARISGLSERHGQARGMLTVDRRHTITGYFFGNVQALTLEENSRKRWVDARRFMQ